MARLESFDPSERLPWLRDPVPKPAPRTWKSSVPLLLMAAAAGAAGAAGWTVLQRAIAPDQAPVEIAPVETVPLRPPAPTQPVEVEPPPLVSDSESLRAPAAPPPVAAPEPRPRARATTPAPRPKARPRKAPAPARSARPQVRAPAAASPARRASPAYDPRAWNSGVRGRIIQLGAFRTPAQAHGQWNRVYYRYPLLRPLPPRVVRTNIRGRTYYRLQLGTFSHAHSELLCQRLRAIGEGCIVLNLKRGRRR